MPVLSFVTLPLITSFVIKFLLFNTILPTFDSIDSTSICMLKQPVFVLINWASSSFVVQFFSNESLIILTLPNNNVLNNYKCFIFSKSTLDTLIRKLIYNIPEVEPILYVTNIIPISYALSCIEIGYLSVRL